MDFTKLLSIAAKKQENAEKQSSSTKMFSTQLSAPQKINKKEEKEKSEVLKKLLEEKEREKRRIELKRQKREEEERKKREEEEKSKRFRIPKVKKAADVDSQSSKKSSASKEKLSDKADTKKSSSHHKQKSVKSGDKVGGTKSGEGTSSKSVKSGDKVGGTKSGEGTSSKSVKSGDKVGGTKSGERTSSKSKSSKSVSSKDKIRKETRTSDKTKNSAAKENNVSVTDKPGDTTPVHIPDFSNKAHAPNWTSKLSEDEQLRIRVEFERKKARLMDSLKKSKDERICIAEGKQGQRFSDVPPDVAKKRAKEEVEAQRKKRRLEEGQKKLPNSENVKKSKHSLEKEPNKQIDTKDEDLKHSRDKRKSLTSQFNVEKSANEKLVKPKPKPVNLNKNKPPPNLNFQDILKLAQTKSKDPVAVLPKKEPIKENRPLTQEEKDRIERKKSKEYRDWYKYGESKPSSSPSDDSQKAKKTNISKSINSSEKPNSCVMKHSQEGKASLALKKTEIVDRKQGAVRQNGASANITSTSSIVRDHHQISKKKESVGFSKNRHSLEPKNSSQVILKNSRLSLDSKSSYNTGNSKLNTSAGSDSKKRKLDMPSSGSLREKIPHSDNKKPRKVEKQYDSTNENVLICRPAEPKVKQEPVASNPWDRIYGQIQKANPKPVKKKKQVIEDDSDEYDEEMDGFIDDDDDDFIDDGDVGMDYSKHIKEIFGYDRTKYRYESDYEIANMESGFREQMKEEARSARLGLQEDLEDMRKEEEELRRKALAKKKAKRRV